MRVSAVSVTQLTHRATRTLRCVAFSSKASVSASRSRSYSRTLQFVADCPADTDRKLQTLILDNGTRTPYESSGYLPWRGFARASHEHVFFSRTWYCPSVPGFYLAVSRRQYRVLLGGVGLSGLHSLVTGKGPMRGTRIPSCSFVPPFLPTLALVHLG